MNAVPLPCAVVTGGSAGIGRAICEALLGEGRRVVSLDRAPATFGHQNLTSIAVDLADRAATRRVAAEVAAAHAPTTLVHSAGRMTPASSSTISTPWSSCISARRSSWCRRCCQACASENSAASS